MTEPQHRATFMELKTGVGNLGATCPHDGCRDFRVMGTWYIKDGRKHRRYVCRHCLNMGRTPPYEFNGEVTETVKIL